jgi:hypothetical protein
MNVETVFVLFALAALFEPVGVVVIDSIMAIKVTEAAGCRTSVAVNASKGRCFKG